MTVDTDTGDGPALSADEVRFRDELRGWLDDNLPNGWGTPDFRLPRDPAERIAWFRDWQATLASGRWVGIHWPEEFGGRDATLLEQVVYHTEIATRKAPMVIGNTGLSICGPTIIVHGTDEQRERFLHPMLTGEHLWCEGFSEPNAGSDLAGLRTRGVIDGDELVINGQKIWTSGAQIADWMFALVRTNPGAPKRHGISFVLVPMDAEGLDVRPIRQLGGDSEFAEVFLDNVRIPLSNVVGDLDHGWQVARTTLSHERSTLFMASQLRFAATLDQVIALAKKTTDESGRPRARDPRLRQRIARTWVNAQLIRVNGARNLGRVMAGGDIGPEGSIAKLFGQESEQELYELALDTAGPAGVLDRHATDAPDRGKWILGYLRTRASTIGGGTSEIQRNIIAERVLGLPRDPWADSD
ncbi:MAG: acyl-CoA dehydrogenase family protein [Acidimicrobiia bacterium]